MAKEKLKPKNKNSRRKTKQRIGARYAKAREDAQLAGILDTTPAGAARNEVVNPETQGEQPLPGLIGVAVRRGWATPEEKKPKIVDELVKMVEDEDLFPTFRIQAARTLQQGDVIQHERDNPEAAGVAKGGTKVAVGVQVQQPSLFEMARAAAMIDPLEEAKKKVEVETKEKS